jgi:sterol desaturase/sphingolipid hydroxylase (fatty acid hydroxylase superfamily)
MPIYQGELNWDYIYQLTSYHTIMNMLRYYPIAGLVFFILYFWKKNLFEKFKIQLKYPNSDRIKDEFIQSFVTLLVFSSIGIGVTFLVIFGYLPRGIYRDPTLHGGIPYVIFTWFALIIFHETWFYWAHRLMHHKLIYSYVHSVHHKSVNPTPVAAYNFHWLEAFIEGLYLVPFMIVFPLYYPLFIAHTFYAMIINIYFHSGYEFFPRGFASHPFFKWINTSTHHNLHHSRFNGNYSLYLNFWDRVMNTNLPNYEKLFDETVSRRVHTNESTNPKIQAQDPISTQA